MWYVASPSGPLPSLFKIFLWGQKWSRPRGHVFYIGLCGENMKKSFCLKPKGLEPLYVVCSITSTKFVQIISHGPKMDPPRRSHVLHRLI